MYACRARQISRGNVERYPLRNARSNVDIEGLPNKMDEFLVGRRQGQQHSVGMSKWALERKSPGRRLVERLRRVVHEFSATIQM